MRAVLPYAVSAAVQLAVIGLLAVCPIAVQAVREVAPDWTIEFEFERGQAPTVTAVSVASPTPEIEPLEPSEQPKASETKRQLDVALPPLERKRLDPELKLPPLEVAQVDSELPQLELDRTDDAPEIETPKETEQLEREMAEALAPPPPSVAIVSVESEVGADVDELPKALPKNPPTPYPPNALARRLSGTVTLRITVGVDGRVEEVIVEHSSGHPELDAAARENRLRWRFLPASKDGMPVRFTVRQQVVFRPNS